MKKKNLIIIGSLLLLLLVIAVKFGFPVKDTTPPKEEIKEENKEVISMDLIKDVFVYLSSSIGKDSYEEVFDYIATTKYKYETITPEEAIKKDILAEIKVYEVEDDYVQIVFYPKGIENTEILSAVRYNNSRYELSISNNYHVSTLIEYNLFDREAVQKNKKVKDINELLEVIDLK